MSCLTPTPTPCPTPTPTMPTFPISEKLQVVPANQGLRLRATRDFTETKPMPGDDDEGMLFVYVKVDVWCESRYEQWCTFHGAARVPRPGAETGLGQWPCGAVRWVSVSVTVSQSRNLRLRVVCLYWEIVTVCVSVVAI
jgi:hypothetical protein